MSKYYFQGFDGKWYVADDHTGPSMLEVIQRRMDSAYKRITEKEETNGQQTGDHIPQCEWKA